MKKTIFITGATAGFGKATAEIFAKDGHRIIITGRRKERLDSLKSELKSNYDTEVLPLNFDVRSRKEVRNAVDSIPENFRDIDILVNNAGLASGLDPIQDGDFEDWDKMIDTNVKGLLYMTEAILPYLKDGSGHIINVGSTAGKEVYPRGNVYCASKYAVDALTKGMRIDLLPRGIKVTQIAPGLAETEFSNVRFHGDQEKAETVYQGYEPLKAEDIAELIRYTTILPPHVCINDLVVSCLAQANSYVVHKDTE